MIRHFTMRTGPFDGSPDTTPVAKLWYSALAHSLERGCQRLHLFLPANSDTFRLDGYARGTWVQIVTPEAIMYPAFLNRLKEMASLGTANHTPVEQGRFGFTHDGSAVDISVTVRSASDTTEDAILEFTRPSPLTPE